ncbi:hypothetical protein EDC94DRAFT_559332 [Helicostylum pulchrum]|nr:hypothetical protein EDC94DRAFT_559332 [Helicostylum pulchrum]
MAVKTTVNNIWKHEYLNPLHELVDSVNLLVTHTIAFSKYIFLQELERNRTFNIQDFVNKEFFVEVFLNIIAIAFLRNGRLKDTTKTFRGIIAKYKEAYVRDVAYIPILLPYAQ